MTENTYRVAPPGFTPDQWEEFQEHGILVFENAIPQEDVKRYIEAIDRVAASDPIRELLPLLALGGRSAAMRSPVDRDAEPGATDHHAQLSHGS